jgi:long-chain acyl-CoA synthetase
MASSATENRRALTEANLTAGTLCAAFQATAEAHAEEPALVLPDGTVTHTYADWAREVREVAAGLSTLGVMPHDCVGLMLTDRAEFNVVDAAVVHLGGVPFSIYNTNPAEQLLPLLDNSGARVIVTELAFLPTVLGARDLRPEGLEHIVVVDGPGGTMTLDALRAAGAGADYDFDAAWRAVAPDDVLTLVYTSGTTGAPKGVQHTHRTILTGLASMDDFVPVTPRGRVCAYLPTAHIAERFISHYSAMVHGLTITCVANPKELPLALATTHPTRLFGVPRIYEKLQAAVMGMVAAEPDGPLARAVEAGLARVRGQQSAAPVTDLAPEHQAVLADVRAKLGLDQAEWVGVAAAPSTRAMLEFFPAIGVQLVHFWGMSECLFSVTSPARGGKLGYVGKAVRGVDIRLGADGEIFVRGPNVMVGYRGEPSKTAEAIDPAGWLASGDVAEADDDGDLKIVDRKKELIINSAGKNMAPSKIEMAVKEKCDLIAQVVAIGDARQYVTALVVLDEDAARAWAVRNGCAPDVASVAADHRVRATIAGAIAAANEKLARVEQIKSHAVLDVTWSPGGDEVTPTMKLKRRVITQKYAATIDGLYATTS